VRQLKKSLKKFLYLCKGQANLNQTFRNCIWEFTPHILQILWKQLIWFKRCSSLNCTVHFFEWTCSCTLNVYKSHITNQTLCIFSSWDTMLESYQLFICLQLTVNRVSRMPTSCRNTPLKSAAKWYDCLNINKCLQQIIPYCQKKSFSSTMLLIFGMYLW